MKFLVKYLALTLLPLYSVAQESMPQAGYSQHPEATAFINKMVKEHQFDREYVGQVLDNAEKKQAILDAIARPAEKTKPWHEYREIFIKPERIKGGVAFWNENKTALEKIANEYGVAPEIIVAIIGVETRYGTYMGSYRVIDALTTLGFDYPERSKFFTSQLEEFFLLTREQQQNPLEFKGSYAGAMGYGQFIPSSYRSFAVDYDGDKLADIWNNKHDAIASIANYFKAHGWQDGEPIAEPAARQPIFPDKMLNPRTRPKTSATELAKLGFTPKSRKTIGKRPAIALQYEGKTGDEYWLGYNNFYVITRYNRSHMYALAVYQLSQEIAKAYAAQ